MFARASRTTLVAKRCMSSSPRMTIAQNIVGMSELVKAKDAAGVAAAKTVKAINPEALPSVLSGHESYLATAAASAGPTAVLDQTSWHNFKGMDFIIAEASRDTTWPFLVGIV